MSLTSWGFVPEFQRAFQAQAEPHNCPARVARRDRTGYLVVHEKGETFARLPGHLRRDPPAVGDWVTLDLTDPPTIRSILPRTTAFVRQAAGRESRAQVIAANIDVVFIVAGLDDDLNLRRIERYLVLAAGSGARAIVVLNKVDLVDEGDPRIEAVRGIAGVTPVLSVSALDGRGLEAIRALVPPGVTAAIVGSSGVGKSSLVNALVEERAMDVGGLRAKDGRGRHTTTARHLIPIPGGGVLLDTPGLRELHMWGAEEGLATVFAEIEELAGQCKFRDCSHEGEPACAVRDRVGPERFGAWQKLRREAAASARKADVRAARQDGRTFGRMARGAQRAKRDRRE